MNATETRPDINRQFALRIIKSNPHLSAIFYELLDALEAIVASAHNGNEPGQTWIMVAGGLIDDAEAAIRKAKGE